MYHLKILKSELPGLGNGWMEIISAFCPKVFMGVVCRATSSTAPSLLFLTQQLLNFYNATPLLCSVLEYCLVCVAQLMHKRSLAGLCSSSLPSPPTKSLVPTVWHSYPSSCTYTYSLENVSFGIWLLQSRNIWEGDKNRIRRRDAEKWNGRQKLGGIFSVPLTFLLPQNISHPSPLLWTPCLGTLAHLKFMMSLYSVPYPHCLLSQKKCLNDYTMGKRRNNRADLFIPSSGSTEEKHRNNNLLSVCLNWFFHFNFLLLSM